MEIPSFVGPLGCALVFLLTVFCVCFYYCYLKPKRDKRRSLESRNTANAKTGENVSHRAKRTQKYSYRDDEFYHNNIPGMACSAGYLAYGGFPVLVTECHEVRWSATAKTHAPVARTFQHHRVPKASTACDTKLCLNKTKTPERSARPNFIRECSVEGRVRTASQLQVIQECEEEREEEENVEKKDELTGDKKCDIFDT